RLWFLEQMEPGTPLYNVLVTIPLPPTTDLVILERALTEVVGRHEILRTTFTSVGGVPEQVVAASRPVVLARIDLGSFPEAQRPSEAARLTTEELRRPFDLATDPLFRATLVSLGSLGHQLLLSMHHIVIDGWSVGVLTREIDDIYRRLREGRPLPA